MKRYEVRIQFSEFYEAIAYGETAQEAEHAAINELKRYRGADVDVVAITATVANDPAAPTTPQNH